ncbi:Na+/proline symporter [Roseovarius azorensis]|uniref:Na+/proline symporter n=1 Tax=Roseovarius azorensis TaxID=1287727 RepID=A0A1H7XS96_9RHOB|nr:hypothetical protein [Roseovarius azorensis]SEM36007.1 Na+/proline symporter [Roseovarius azorensis]
MTSLLIAALAGVVLYGVYIAARTARTKYDPAAYLDGANALPGWAAMLILPGIVIAGLGVERHLWMIGSFGLQASHIGIGAVPAALTALLIWTRLWYVTRTAGLSTPGEALGQYYGSTALRIVVVVLALLFALPFAANALSFAALLLEDATSGLITRIAGVWLLALGGAFAAIIGGWRGTVLTAAMLSVLLLGFLPTATLLVEVTAADNGFSLVPGAVAEGVLHDRLPGVLQNVFGIGKSIPAGGIFSAVGVASNVLAMIGIVISPVALYLAQTSAPSRLHGTSAVWLTGGLVGGILLIGAPFLGLRIAGDPVALARLLYTIEPLGGVLMLMAVITGALLMVSFFVTGGSILIAREVVLSYLLPNLSPEQKRLAARITLGFVFFFMAFMASFLPVSAAVGASLALPLSVQLLPAILGLTFLRWVSLGAVLAGGTLGALIVLFTEPPGIMLFEWLFVDLPWGRWPLTIHSAAWGLTFNLLLVLLASAATLRRPERFESDRLHNALDAASGPSRRGLGALGGVFIIWSFFAYGPGAVIGNTFFSDPIFTALTPVLGVPSLWVWQILFWLMGVPLIWLLAFITGYGRTSIAHVKRINFGTPPRKRPPDWIASSLARLT